MMVILNTYKYRVDHSDDTLIFHALNFLTNLIGVCFQELAKMEQKYHVS